MKTFYKIFLALFIIFIGVNLYAIDYNISIMDNENSKFLFSIASGLLGIIVVYILHTWSKLAEKQ